MTGDTDFSDYRSNTSDDDYNRSRWLEDDGYDYTPPDLEPRGTAILWACLVVLVAAACLGLLFALLVWVKHWYIALPVLFNLVLLPGIRGQSSSYLRLYCDYCAKETTFEFAALRGNLEIYKCTECELCTKSFAVK